MAENDIPLRVPSPTLEQIYIPSSTMTVQAGTPVDKLFQPPATHDPPMHASTMIVSQVGTGNDNTGDVSKSASIRQLTGSHWKMAKQYVKENLGKASKTVDQVVDEEISKLKDTQFRYREILLLANQYTTHLERMLQVQKAMAESFAMLSVKDSELRLLFDWNVTTQKTASKHGEQLILALAHFSNSLYTLSERTIEDTQLTIRHYENARILFDACRTDLETAEANQNLGKSVSASKMSSLQSEYEKSRDKFEKLKKDVTVKTRLLDENRLKVMSQQLKLLAKAFQSYYSGCYSNIEPLIQEMEENMDSIKNARNQSQMFLASWLDTVNHKSTVSSNKENNV